MLAGRGPSVVEITLVNAGQEYPLPIQDGNNNAEPCIKAIQFRCQDTTSAIEYAFAAGGPYFSLRANEVYWKDNIEWHNATLYFKSAIAGAIVEIELWH